MSMPRRLTCGLMLVLSCFASYSQDLKSKTEEPLEATPQLRLERYFDTSTQMFGNTRAEIIENLGKPKLVRTENDLMAASELTREDARLVRGHGVENGIFELSYEGLLLKILKVNSPPYREFVYEMTVTSNRYKMLWNLNVGSPRQEVRHILGDPSNPHDLKDSYAVVHSGTPPEVYTPDLVTFNYRDSLVSRIQFWRCID